MSDTVLLVDDDHNLLLGLRRTLRKQPYELVTADSGRAALALLARRPVDVIVSDEKMPEMSGTEFLAQARRLYPDTVRLMLTGEATLEAAVRAINEGEIYRFLRKPCDQVELSVAIAQGLQQKKLLENARRLLRVSQRQAAMLETVARQVFYPGTFVRLP